MTFNIFFCYAHEDEVLLHKLIAHLKPLQHQGLVDELWHDRDISAGSEWEPEIVRKMYSANVILLLISSSFMNSDYCFGKELWQAIERHERKEARVIPIILSPVYWQISPLDKLQALPKDAKPITGAGWHSEDEALVNVVKGIGNTIREMQKKRVTRHSYLYECIAEQTSKGKSITEALNHCDPDLAAVFTAILTDYIKNDHAAFKNDHATLLMEIEKLLQEVSAVGDRDLRVRGEVTPDALGIVADAINYMIEELAKTVIRIQKTTMQIAENSNHALSALEQQVQTLERIAQAAQTFEPTRNANMSTLLINTHQSTKALREYIERIRDLSNLLYASVSSYRLPPEESLYLGE